MAKQFHTIDEETLMSCPLKLIHFVVGDLLSQELHLLAGAPKSAEVYLCEEVPFYLRQERPPMKMLLAVSPIIAACAALCAPVWPQMDAGEELPSPLSKGGHCQFVCQSVKSSHPQ